MKALNGHTYARAYCTTRQAWRTFRVDRISAILAKSPVTEERAPDGATNWLTQVGDEGVEVVVVMEAHCAGSSSRCPAHSGWPSRTAATPSSSASATSRSSTT